MHPTVAGAMLYAGNLLGQLLLKVEANPRFYALS